MSRRLAGLVQAAQRTKLGFEVAGRVASVRVDDGDPIQRNEVLATLEPRTFDLAVREARAALAGARASAGEAADTLERSRALLERGAETRAAFLRAEASEARTRSRVAQAQATLATALERRADATLRAPFDGRVASRLIEPSETVRVGQTVLQIQGDRGFEVLVSAPSAVAERVAVGSTHRVVFLGRKAELSGRVVQVAARPNARQAYPVTLRLTASPDFLRSGMTAEVELALPTGATDAVSIPVEAFRFRSENESAVVYVFDEAAGTVRERAVEIAEVDDDRALVTSGLERGERLADRGVAFLRDGQAVTLLGVGPDRFEGSKEARR